jgi:hypothetical protein
MKGTRGGHSTPEITARTRESLEGNSVNMQDKKDQLMEMMSEQFTNQQQERLALREALRYSQEEKKAASVAYIYGNKPEADEQCPNYSGT